MAFSKIVIEFDVIPDVDSVISFAEEQNGLTITETFKAARLGSKQAKIPLETSPGVFNGTVAGNYMSAFYYDYNYGSQFYAYIDTPLDSPGRGKITIFANYANAFFSVITNTAGATITIVNDTQTNFLVTDESFQAADTSPCANVKVVIQTSTLAVNILQPFFLAGNTDNPIIFEYLRGQQFNLRLQDANGTIINRLINTAPYLNPANFNININNTPNGATVTITANNSNGLEIEYSLDGSTWQTENVFTGLGIDDYTLYIRDHIGCSTSIDFDVNEFGIYIPFFYLSKSNPIRYALRTIWGDSANYKNDENTLSCEVDVKLPYKETQQFQSADVITTQFKSNYAYNLAKVIKSDLSEVDIPVVKKSSNIGNKDKRDAIKFDYGNGKTGVYFQSGNLYDFDTNVIVDTYSLNGSLPYWASVGNYIIVGSGWYVIEEVIFDDVRNCDAIVFSGIHVGPDEQIIVGSVFNFHNYEVYEYSIDMLDYLDQNIRVKLICTDPHFTEIVHLSEVINVKVKQENTVEFRYRNTTNTDVFYSTGIEFKMRQLFQKVNGSPDQKQENNKTDTNVYLTSADVYEGDEFIFEPVTKGIMLMMVLALSHEILYLNEVGYVKNDSVDIEGPLEDTNLYIVKAKMIKNGNVYNSQASGSGNQIYNGSNLNVPGLVDFGGGFVQY